MCQFILFIVVLVLLCSFLLWLRKANLNVPPGPQGFPLLGNLLQLGSEPHLKFQQWAEKYKKLYTIYFVNKPVLVISDAKLMKELLSMMPATRKFSTEVLAGITKGCYGVGLSDGETWLEQRHFFLKTLKQFGFGRGKTIEEGVLGEVQDFTSWLENEQQKNGNVIVHKKLMQCSISIVWTMVTGQRIDNHESGIIKLMDEFMDNLQKVTKSGLIFIPALKYIAPKWSGAQDYEAVLKKLHTFINEYIREHKTTRIKDTLPRDIIDAYIEKAENCENPVSSFYGDEGWKHVFASVISLFLAGGESPGAAINFGINYLAVNQQAQKKMQEEIDKFIGSSRDPCLADKMNMPYMEAAVLEILRLATIGPMGIIHELTENVNFEGYNLPKGMLLIPNIYHIHYDKTVWGDPECFRPERFLGEDGKNLKDFVVAFQPGKRTCPAESQTKDILFLFISKLLQQYTFSMDKSVKDPKEYFKASMGLALLPHKLPVVVTKRHR